MMKKSGLFLAILLLLQAKAYALGLGNVDLHSQLGEKLNATMPIIGMENWEITDINVAIASQETYKKLGIDFMPGHLKLNFQIKMNERHKPVLFITTKDSIKEPYLNFVLEVSSPQGRMLKNVSLLLDTPDAAGSQ